MTEVALDSLPTCDGVPDDWPHRLMFTDLLHAGEVVIVGFKEYDVPADGGCPFHVLNLASFISAGRGKSTLLHFKIETMFLSRLPVMG